MFNGRAPNRSRKQTARRTTSAARDRSPFRPENDSSGYASDTLLPLPTLATRPTINSPYSFGSQINERQQQDQPLESAKQMPMGSYSEDKGRTTRELMDSRRRLAKMEAKMKTKMAKISSQGQLIKAYKQNANALHTSKTRAARLEYRWTEEANVCETVANEVIFDVKHSGKVAMGAIVSEVLQLAKFIAQKGEEMAAAQFAAGINGQQKIYTKKQEIAEKAKEIVPEQYKCTKCPKEFGALHWLNKHVANFHPDNSADPIDTTSHIPL